MASKHSERAIKSLPTRHKVNTRHPLHAEFRKKILEALEHQSAANILKYHEQFKEIWELYCRTRRLELNEFLESKKHRRQAIKYISKVKNDAILQKRKEKTIVSDNYVIYEVEKIEKEKRKPIIKTKKHTKEPQPYKPFVAPRTDLSIVGDEPDFMNYEPEQRERSQTERKVDQYDSDEITENEVIKKTLKIERRKISEISFASDITVSTVKRIEELSKFKQYFCEDYLYFLGGGKELEVQMPDGKIRKRFKEQLSHLEIGNNMRHELKKLSDQVVEQMSNNNYDVIDKLNDLEKKINAINDVVKAATELDLAPVQFINSIEDGEFSAQKVLQGAILNDRSMLDNGNIVLEEKKKAAELNKDDLNDDLKKLGSSVFSNHLEDLSDKTIDQEKNDEEV